MEKGLRCNSLWNSPYHVLLDRYIYVARLHRNVLERQLSKTGVYRSQHQFLKYIYDNPNVSQKDIANHFHVSTATVAVTLKKLDKGDYIHRGVYEEDNRFNQLCITEKGRAVVEESIQVFQMTEQKMFEGFDAAEQEQLSGYLDRLCENLEGQLEEIEREEQL